MSFLLDTDICSFHVKRQSGLIHRFIQHSGGLFISTITLAELYAWAHRRMIAATAIVHNLTLVTHNTADYQNIPSLRLDDWLTP